MTPWRRSVDCHGGGGEPSRSSAADCCHAASIAAAAERRGDGEERWLCGPAGGTVLVLLLALALWWAVLLTVGASGATGLPSSEHSLVSATRAAVAHAGVDHAGARSDNNATANGSTAMVALSGSVAHPVWAAMPADPSLPSRMLLVAPSVAEQQTGPLDVRRSLAWLRAISTTISRAPLQMHIFSPSDLSPRLHLLQQPCGAHPPPAAAFLSYIVRHYGWIADRLAVQPTYSRTQTLPDGTGRDRVQLLARLKWEALDTQLDFVPLQLHNDSYRCEDTAGMSASRQRLLSHLLSMLVARPESASPGSSVPPLAALRSALGVARVCYSAGEDEWVVTRRAVQTRPVEVYQRLLNAVCSPPADYSQSDVAHALHSVWHVVFGQSATLRQSSESDMLVRPEAFPFYGRDRLTAVEWKRNTAPAQLDDMLLSERYRSQPPMWQPHCSVALPQRDERCASAALVVAAFRESVAFLQSLPADLHKLVYRMRAPTLTCSHAVNDSGPTLGNGAACGPLTPAAGRQGQSTVGDTLQQDSGPASDPVLDAGTSRLHDSYGHCNEASSYLQFIVHYYHQLPEFVFFIHAHEQSWHSRNITDTLLKLDWAAIRRLNGSHPHPFYHSLNGWQMVYELTSERWHIMAAHWHEMFLGQLQAAPEYPPYPFAYHCCAQFLVHRSAILARPLSFWRHLYSWCRTTTVKPHFAGRIIEWAWPLLLGQPLATRMADVTIRSCGNEIVHESCHDTPHAQPHSPEQQQQTHSH